MASIAASLAMLVARALARRTGSHFKWWGIPVVMLGAGDTALSLMRKLRYKPHLGLRPVAVVTDQGISERIDDVPVHRYDSLKRIAAAGVRYAIVATPELRQSEFVNLMKRVDEAFPRVILIPDTDSLWNTGTLTRDFAGVVGLELQNNSSAAESRLAKRLIDLTCSFFLALLFLPVMAVICFLVVIDSGRPVFYGHQRRGRGDRSFRLWKFRTMDRNSAELLERLLASNPEARREWAENQKLHDDPRITRIGKILRKTSLDELPQLWNVIRGEMSLVGPRPIVTAEIEKYQESYSMYSRATPGITGLWQVSGRNQTTYTDRVAYDTYYVRNWSVWMDLYLLVRTIGVVITGSGAC